MVSCLKRLHDQDSKDFTVHIEARREILVVWFLYSDKVGSGNRMPNHQFDNLSRLENCGFK